MKCVKGRVFSNIIVAGYRANCFQENDQLSLNALLQFYPYYTYNNRHAVPADFVDTLICIRRLHEVAAHRRWTTHYPTAVREHNNITARRKLSSSRLRHIYDNTIDINRTNSIPVCMICVHSYLPVLGGRGGHVFIFIFSEYLFHPFTSMNYVDYINSLSNSHCYAQYGYTIHYATSAPSTTSSASPFPCRHL